MNLKSRGTVEKSFQDLSNSISDSEKLLIETRLLMYRFLSEIDKITSERGINRKELAILAGTSASFITQLYQGKKIINLQMLTRIKKALNIDFKIEVVSFDRKIKSDCEESEATLRKISVPGTRHGVGLNQKKIAKSGRTENRADLKL
jgi:transcriptional regulator with XRE-family HTH domain